MNNNECRCGDDCPRCKKCDFPLCECYCEFMDEENYEDDLNSYK